MPRDDAIALVQTDEIMLEFGIPESERHRVERLVNVASSRIERYCRSRFKARAITQTLNGSGHPTLDLGGPIISVTSVVLAGTALVSTDYQILAARGQLYRAGGWLGSDDLTGSVSGINNVVVNAMLGYAALPHEVVEACIWLVRYWRGKLRGSGGADPGMRSETIGEYSYTRFGPSELGTRDMPLDIPAEVTGMLDPYVRWPV